MVALGEFSHDKGAAAFVLCEVMLAEDPVFHGEVDEVLKLDAGVCRSTRWRWESCCLEDDAGVRPDV